VKLNFLPLNGAEIALRIPEAKTETEQNEAPDDTLSGAEGGAA